MLEPSVRGVLIRCGTKVSDDDMVLSWRFKPLVNSLETEGEAAELPGLKRRSIQLGESTPARLLTGTVVGPRVAEVVTVLGAQTLIVNATTAGVDAAVTSKTLEETSTQIAAAYTR
ncbi:MAG: hypothetical protein H0X12_08485 [Nocardioides sp.]|nr:hypothetical protein [Nocardioides sp.]